MELKVTKTVERINRKDVTTFFVNHIEVATCTKYKEYFCTIKNGTPSNIRDKQKTAKETRWNQSGLIALMGHNNFVICSPIRLRSFGNNPVNPDFMNDYPDLTWGDSGSILTASKIKELIIKCMQKPDI